jgi:hypothetical protein
VHLVGFYCENSFINPSSCTSKKHTQREWWKTILLDAFISLYYICFINEYLPVSYDKHCGKTVRVKLSTLVIIHKYWCNTFRIILSPHINNKYWGNIFGVTLRTHINNKYRSNIFGVTAHTFITNTEAIFSEWHPVRTFITNTEKVQSELNSGWQ